MDQTKVMDGTLVRVMSWYDNEWGFSNRMGSFAPNPPAYDPHYHYQLAIEAGLSAYAAPWA
jgi:hypothetical protein